MDTSTPQNHWRTVLNEQGRSLSWLALQTGKPRRTVYAYASGQIKNPPAAWLAAVSRVLGEEVAA